MSLPDVIMPEVPPDNLESSPREENLGTRRCYASA